MDYETIIEESVRKIRGLAYLMDRMACSDNLEQNEDNMFGLLADTANGIANDLEAIIKNKE